MAEEPLQPSLHRPIPMGTRVVIPASATGLSESLAGTVEGIAFIHVVFAYIVVLDKTLSTPYGDQRALSVPGTVLEAPDGSNWKLDLAGF